MQGLLDRAEPGLAQRAVVTWRGGQQQSQSGVDYHHHADPGDKPSGARDVAVVDQQMQLIREVHQARRLIIPPHGVHVIVSRVHHIGAALLVVGEDDYAIQARSEPAELQLDRLVGEMDSVARRDVEHAVAVGALLVIGAYVSGEWNVRRTFSTLSISRTQTVELVVPY